MLLKLNGELLNSEDSRGIVLRILTLIFSYVTERKRYVIEGIEPSGIC